MPEVSRAAHEPRRLVAMILLRVNLHKHGARALSHCVEESCLRRVAQRLPGVQSHSLADSRHVRVELIGQKEDLPLLRRWGARSARRVDVETRLSGDLDKIAV